MKQIESVKSVVKKWMTPHPRRIPKGFRRKAQGCPESTRGTLGCRAANRFNRNAVAAYCLPLWDPGPQPRCGW